MRSGYPAVSTSEIGKGVGIAGPGLYRSFSSKQAILDALIRRFDEWSSLECIRAIRGNQRDAQTSAGTRARAGSGSASTSRTWWRSRSPNCRHASAEVRDAYLRNQGDRDAVWIELIRKLVPETTVAEARLLVAAAISFIEDVARTWHLTRCAGVADEMTAIALSILTSRATAPH